MKDLFKLFVQPGLRSSSLVVSWNADAGKLGPKVTDYLNEKLGGQSFGEIEPVDFFPLGGVAVEDDLIQFPESRFYFCPKNGIVIFKSDPPSSEWYKFLSLILDAAEHYCHTKELYTIGGMISPNAHTTPRTLFGISNSSELKQALSQYNLGEILDYETPPGQRPTLSSFLLWLAKRRNIPGANLWVPIPFYLVAVEDPQAQKKALKFFDERLSLQLDFQNIDEKITKQNEKIAQIRIQSPEVDEYIGKLESNLRLSEEENEALVKVMGEILREKRG